MEASKNTHRSTLAHISMDLRVWEKRERRVCILGHFGILERKSRKTSLSLLRQIPKSLNTGDDAKLLALLRLYCENEIRKS